MRRKFSKVAPETFISQFHFSCNNAKKEEPKSRDLALFLSHPKGMCEIVAKRKPEERPLPTAKTTTKEKKMSSFHLVFFAYFWVICDGARTIGGRIVSSSKGDGFNHRGPFSNNSGYDSGETIYYTVLEGHEFYVVNELLFIIYISFV